MRPDYHTERWRGVACSGGMDVAVDGLDGLTGRTQRTPQKHTVHNSGQNTSLTSPSCEFSDIGRVRTTATGIEISLSFASSFLRLRFDTKIKKHTDCSHK